MIGAGLPCQCSLVILCHICTTRFLCVDDTIASAQVKGTAWFQDHDVPVGVCPPFHFYGMCIVERYVSVIFMVLWLTHTPEHSLVPVSMTAFKEDHEHLTVTVSRTSCSLITLHLATCKVSEWTVFIHVD